MDDIKDNQKGDSFSRFIDSQHVKTDPFGKNRAAERLYRRVERLVAALYLLTRHIPETEPLKLEIRSRGIALLEKVLDLKDEMRAAESDALGSFETAVRGLISLVRILTAAGRISFQNADTVIGALDELVGFINSSQRSPLSEVFSFTREDIMGDMSPLYDRNVLKDIRDTKKVVRDNTDTDSTRTEPTGSRAQGIVSVLRGAGELGIKDISARLPDYSEKMIQRELAALVKSGQVKKDGFKRWSKYSLVQ
ncbi:MAG: hypothetical protein P4L81_01345 [Candidatus Pacebacteria bacterium]|nr:hypothetical protein [Candidatus Paceibacterota bacterium]